MDESMAGRHVIHWAIILDDNKTHYETGEEVSGVLNITVKDELAMSDLKIGLVCRAEVHWNENSFQPMSVKEVAYLPNNNFGDNKQYLDLKYDLRNENTNGDKYLDEGKHVIPFKFKLPEGDIPSSFESYFGSINYYVEAVIEENYRIASKIIVHAPLHDELKISVGGSSEKELGILNLAKGKISFNASVGKRGFIPGEFIELHITVSNESTVDVIPRATLYQTEIYMCGESHKSIKNPLSEPVIGLKVDKESKSSEIINIEIPNETPLSIKSSIISVKYHIHVTLDIPHAIDLHLNIPIVITNKKP